MSTTILIPTITKQDFRNHLIHPNSLYTTELVRVEIKPRGSKW